MMRKKLTVFLCVPALCCALMPSAFAFAPAPKTAYAQQFVQRCEGQQRLLNEAA